MASGVKVKVKVTQRQVARLGFRTRSQLEDPGPPELYYTETASLIALMPKLGQNDLLSSFCPEIQWLFFYETANVSDSLWP